MRRLRLTVALAAVLLSCVVVADAGAVPGPALTVDAGADRHPISPAIYGMNGADPALAAELRLPVDRWGGNDKERYNWRIATKNTGSDYFFENVADCFQKVGGCNALDPAADGLYRPLIAREKALAGTTVMQIPLVGSVAKDDGLPIGHDHPFPCGFPRDQYPLVAQSSWDRFDTNCGNGRAADVDHPAVVDRPGNGGNPIPVPPADEDAVRARTGAPFGPPEAKAWVQDLVARYGDAAQGGVGYYELGNEPNLWNSSHRDVHPDPTTYDELLARSVPMAQAIKEADPTAKVIGFSEWGWTNYFCSAEDVAPLGYGCDRDDPDRARHDHAELSAWYLADMKDAADPAHPRLLDDFDLHYYTQDGAYGLQASRSLWDPFYVDDSWIGTAGEDKPIGLLPRMRKWVDENYPGTGISLSEYNLTDLSDASKNTPVATLSEADALGIFAREDVDMAAMWEPPAKGDLVADAFRLYRNYDGSGGRFGETWINSVSADQNQLSVYGAQRTSDGALTLAVVNKTDTTLDAPLALADFAAGAGTQVWQWIGCKIVRQPDADATSGTLTKTYPKTSMTLLVVPAAGRPLDVAPAPPADTRTCGDQPPHVDPPHVDDPPIDPPQDPPSDPPAPIQPGPPVVPPKTFPTPPPKPVAPLARLITTKVTLRGRVITLRASCPKGALRCSGTLTVRSGRTALGSAKLSLKAGRTTNVRLTFSRARARTVAKYGRAGRTVKATIVAGKRSRTTSLRLRGR